MAATIDTLWAVSYALTIIWKESKLRFGFRLSVSKHCPSGKKCGHHNTLLGSSVSVGEMVSENGNSVCMLALSEKGS